MDSTGSLELTSKANSGRQFDDGRLILDGFGSVDGCFHGIGVMITILDMQSVPSIRFETFQDVFGESA